MKKQLFSRAILASVVLAILGLAGLCGLGVFDRNAPVSDPAIGEQGTPFSVTSRQDLESVYAKSFEAVRSRHVETAKLIGFDQWRHLKKPLRTETQLREAIAEMVKSLGDKRTRYITTKELDDFERAASGKMFGIGIGISMDGRVTNIVPGSPAEIHLRMYDQIVAINGQPTAGQHPHNLVKMIKGAPSDDITFDILRESFPQREKKKLLIRRTWFKTADPITFHVGDVSNGGYIKVNSLRAESVIGDTLDVLKRMNEQGIPGMILDLRNLKGGSAEAAAKLAALFLKEGHIVHARERAKGGGEVHTSYTVKDEKLVLTRQEPGKSPVETVLLDKVNVFTNPLVIIVDETTVGGAEIVARALKDQKRAIVVGFKTPGKGTGQSSVRLTREHAMRITTSLYFAPDRTPLEGTGVTPNTVVGANERWRIYMHANNALLRAMGKEVPDASRSTFPFRPFP